MLDTYARISPDSDFVKERPEELYLCAGDITRTDDLSQGELEAYVHRVEHLRERGARVLQVHRDKDGHLSLPHVLQELSREEIRSLMVEQAIYRAGTKAGNKGWDTALSVLEKIE